MGEVKHNVYVVWDGRTQGMPQFYNDKDKAQVAYGKIVNSGFADIDRGLHLTLFKDISTEEYRALAADFGAARDNGFEGLETVEVVSHKSSADDWVAGSLTNVPDDDFGDSEEDYQV